MKNNDQDICREDREEYLKECFVYNINLSKRAYCANQLGKLYYGYAETMPLSIEYYLAAYVIDPKNPEYIHNLSRAYYFVEDFDKAEPFLEKCTEVDVPNLEKSICAFKLSNIYRTKKIHLEKVINYLELIRQLEPKNPQNIYSLALEHERLGNYLEAEKLLQECVNIDEKDIENKYTIASCASTWGDMYSAGKIEEKNVTKILFSYSVAYNLIPEEPVYLKKAMLAFYSLKKYDLVEELLIKCVEEENYTKFINVVKAECANWLGSLYLTEKNIDSDNIINAVNAYYLAKQLDSDNPIHNYNLALTYYKFNSNYKETASLLEECLNANYTEKFTNIEKSKCSNKLATLYYDGKLKAEDAKDTADNIIKYYKLAYELNQNHVYLYNLGVTYFYAGLYVDAFPVIKECKENISNSFSPKMQQDCYDKYLELVGDYLSLEFLSL